MQTRERTPEKQGQPVTVATEEDAKTQSKFKCLDIPTAAEDVGYSVRHFRRILVDDGIPILQIGRKFFVLDSDLQQWKDARKAKGPLFGDRIRRSSGGGGETAVVSRQNSQAAYNRLFESIFGSPKAPQLPIKKLTNFKDPEVEERNLRVLAALDARNRRSRKGKYSVQQELDRGDGEPED